MCNKLLKAAIILSDMKQFQLAKKLKCSTSTLSQIVNEYRPVTDDEKKQIADELGREVSDLWPEHISAVIV